MTAFASAGHPIQAALYTETESHLDPVRSRRIPGIDAAEAQSIVDALVATGGWDASGQRIARTVADAERLAGTVVLPVSVSGQASEIVHQIAFTLADHWFSATFANPAVAVLAAEAVSGARA